MAEVIGLVASVGAVLQLTDQVITAVQGYISGVKSAKGDIEAIQKELSSLNGVLKELEAFLTQTDHEPTRMSVTKQCRPALGDCDTAMKNILQKLETKSAKPSRRERLTFGVLRKELLWPLQKADVETLRNIVSRRREIIQLALTVDIAYVNDSLRI
jgi:hypothetical protein